MAGAGPAEGEGAGATPRACRSACATSSAPLAEFAAGLRAAVPPSDMPLAAGAGALHPRGARPRSADRRVPAGLGAAAPADELPRAGRARPAARHGQEPRRAEGGVRRRNRGEPAGGNRRRRREIHRLDLRRPRGDHGDRSAAGRRWSAIPRWSTRATASRCRCSIRRRRRAKCTARACCGCSRSRSANGCATSRARSARTWRSAPLKDDIVAAALDRTFLAESLPMQQAEFARRVRGGPQPPQPDRAGDAARSPRRSSPSTRRCRRSIAGVQKAYPQAAEDVKQQFARLLQPGFLARTPWERLQHLPRYLKAAALRLDKLRADPARDAQRAGRARAARAGLAARGARAQLRATARRAPSSSSSAGCWRSCACRCSRRS